LITGGVGGWREGERGRGTGRVGVGMNGNGYTGHSTLYSKFKALLISPATLI